MKVGDKVNHLEIGGDYEGVYIMRVGWFNTKLT
jgi:hypothetical protein